jgi:glycosyltransferase involved in cell wall biosynthesis
VPHVLEVHHIVGYPVAASLTETVGRWMSWLYLPSAIRRSSGCRTVSKGTAETLMRWGVPQAKIRVVPSFYLDADLIKNLGHRPAVRYDVVFCGRLVPNKGARQLLEAVADLPKVSLQIIGDGPERPWLEERARDLGIQHRIEFRGWMPTQQDVLQAVRSSKMLVMNSTSEGGPRIALEAMAAGVPVIVTRVGVMPDVIVDGVNGLFTTGKSDDLRVKIERLLHDEQLRQRMGSEAEKILERFERFKLITNYAHFLRSFARS